MFIVIIPDSKSVLHPREYFLNCWFDIVSSSTEDKLRFSTIQINLNNSKILFPKLIQQLAVVGWQASHHLAPAVIYLDGDSDRPIAPLLRRDLIPPATRPFSPLPAEISAAALALASTAASPPAAASCFPRTGTQVKVFLEKITIMPGRSRLGH